MAQRLEVAQMLVELLASRLFRHGAILCRRQDAELTLGMFLNVIRYALGKNWSPRGSF